MPLSKNDHDAITLARFMFAGIERLHRAPNGEALAAVAPEALIVLLQTLFTTAEALGGLLGQVFEMVEGRQPATYGEILGFVRRLGLTAEQWAELESPGPDAPDAPPARPAFPCEYCSRPIFVDDRGGIIRKECACGGWRINPD